MRWCVGDAALRRNPRPNDLSRFLIRDVCRRRYAVEHEQINQQRARKCFVVPRPLLNWPSKPPMPLCPALRTQFARYQRAYFAKCRQDESGRFVVAGRDELRDHTCDGRPLFGAGLWQASYWRAADEWTGDCPPVGHAGLDGGCDPLEDQLCSSPNVDLGFTSSKCAAAVDKGFECTPL